MDININDKDFFSKSYDSVKSKKHLSIYVDGWKLKIITKAMILYVNHLYVDVYCDKKLDKKYLIPFAFYAMITPVFWSVIILATIEGMQISFIENEGISVSLSPQGDK